MRPSLDPLESRLAPGHLGAPHHHPHPLPPPPVQVAPLPPVGSPGDDAGDDAGDGSDADPNAGDTGTGYPGDFPKFIPIYPVEISPGGPAF